jgi:hypothetical protein
LHPPVAQSSDRNTIGNKRFPGRDVRRPIAAALQQGVALPFQSLRRIATGIQHFHKSKRLLHDPEVLPWQPALLKSRLA